MYKPITVYNAAHVLILVCFMYKLNTYDRTESRGLWKMTLNFL